MNWIIQDSNNQHKNWVKIYDAAISVGDSARFISVENDSELSDIKEYSMVIGGDDFIDKCNNNKYLKTGIIRDYDFFNTDNYKKLYGYNYLNYDSKSIYIKDLKKMNKSSRYFIRPFYDNKIFDGGVYSIDDFMNRNPLLKENFKISISSPKKIEAEWRFIIVCKTIITASSYAGNIKIGKNLEDFIISCIDNDSSPDAYVIDAVLSNGEYRIIECNTINSSNFYDCDFEKIVKTIDDLMLKRISCC